MNFWEFLSENASTIASTFIALFALYGVLYSAKSQRKTKSMEVYFEAQLQAYTELFKIAAELERDLKQDEERDIRQLIIAAKNAEILSPTNLANVIDDFCSVYTQYLTELDNHGLSGSTYSEWKTSLSLMTALMREELLRHTSSKREYDKVFKRVLSKEQKHK